MRNLLIVFILLIGNSTFAQFIDKYQEIGVEHISYSRGFLGGGAVFFDYNKDGFEDLYITGAEFPDKLYQNFGDGTFFDVSTQSQVVRYTEDYYTSAVISGDIDNDGCEDLFVTTYNRDRRNIVLRNNCNGTFTNISFAAGVRDETASVGAGFVDYNKDGFLDVYVLNYIDEFKFIADENDIIVDIERKCFPDYFYINNGDLTFTESSELYDLNNAGCGLAIQPTDYDFDGDQDIYVANDHGQYVVPNTLYRNDYPIDQFTNYSDESGLGVGMYAMGVAAGDYDEDGYLDYYLSNLGNNKLLRNKGDFTYENKAPELDLEIGFHHDSVSIVSWGTFFFDYDNDTDLDLYVANGFITTGFFVLTVEQDTNRLFMNKGDATFQDITEPSGLLNDEINRGAIYGDYDHDGDLDMFVVNNSDDSTDRSSFYQNTISNSNNWIQLKLEGDETVNLNAFGSLIYAYKGGRKFIRELSSGGTYASQHSQYLHFGLGSYSGVDSLVIKWPDNSYSKFYDLEANHRYFTKMGTSSLEILGCTNPSSPNFDEDATLNAGCVIDKIQGCTDPGAKNYNPESNFNDGSCDYSVDVITGLETKKSDLRVYPNPFTDQLIINNSIANKKYSVYLYDMTGRTIMIKELRIQGQHRIRTPSVKSGIYFLVVKDANEKVVFSSKLIKDN